MVAPVRTYQTVLHGQVVTVSVYQPCAGVPEAPSQWGVANGWRVRDRFRVDPTFYEEPATARRHVKVVDMTDVCNE